MYKYASLYSQDSELTPVKHNLIIIL